MEIERKYLYGMIAIVALISALLAWYFFLKASPYAQVVGTYCSNSAGSSYCYELKDDGTYSLNVKRAGTDRQDTFESQYRIKDNEINLDSPNEQIGKRTIFTVEGNRLCADGECLFVKQE
ncbi:MAG: hypothetical protein WC828_00900 [Thermoleophilia bacterium]|jgi:hypothetical protein